MMDGSQSLNHCMLGHVMEWYYGYVAGIRQQPGSVGWKQIVIGPNPGPLTHAEATLATPAGRILSRWRIEEGTFHLKVEIPEGVERDRHPAVRRAPGRSAPARRKYPRTVQPKPVTSTETVQKVLLVNGFQQHGNRLHHQRQCRAETEIRATRAN